MRRTTALLVLDVVLVVAFCAIGRRSHEEASSLTGLANTAWPFLSGLAAGWLVVAARLRGQLGGSPGADPAAVLPSGVIIWAATLVIGMILRVVSGQGIAVSFVIVAGTVLAIFLLGPRALLTVRRRRLTV